MLISMGNTHEVINKEIELDSARTEKMEPIVR